MSAQSIQVTEVFAKLRRHWPRAFAILLLAAAPFAKAADYTITLFQQIGGNSGHLSDYTTFTGSISVADAAIRPNALLFWNTPDITAYHVDIAGASSTYQFRLVDDIFPPLDNPNTLNPTRQGLLFDSQAQPILFYTPDSGLCSCYIVDTADRPGYGQRPLMSFDQLDFILGRPIVVDQDGNFIRLSNLPAGQTPKHVIAGTWRFDSGFTPNMPELDRFIGYYMITSAVPEPSAPGMLIAGLLALVGLRSIRAHESAPA